ncbi:hypothetical protein [Moorena producens]|uniref:hypothetical protein n=1 Tax=Moorena producens TaxID=1155739 RepID=UPI003C7628D1
MAVIGNRESGIGNRESGEVWGGREMGRWEVWEVWEVWGDGEMGRWGDGEAPWTPPHESATLLHQDNDQK